jgi:hypothetical protein
MDENTAVFLEENILSTFLLIGLWGSITLFIDHYIHSFSGKLLTYIMFVVISFTLMNKRNHIRTRKNKYDK